MENKTFPYDRNNLTSIKLGIPPYLLNRSQTTCPNVLLLA